MIRVEVEQKFRDRTCIVRGKVFKEGGQWDAIIDEVKDAEGSYINDMTSEEEFDFEEELITTYLDTL